MTAPSLHLLYMGIIAQSYVNSQKSRQEKITSLFFKLSFHDCCSKPVLNRVDGINLFLDCVSIGCCNGFVHKACNINPPFHFYFSLLLVGSFFLYFWSSNISYLQTLYKQWGLEYWTPKYREHLILRFYYGCSLITRQVHPKCLDLCSVI